MKVIIFLFHLPMDLPFSKAVMFSYFLTPSLPFLALFLLLLPPPTKKNKTKQSTNTNKPAERKRSKSTAWLGISPSDNFFGDIKKASEHGLGKTAFCLRKGVEIYDLKKSLQPQLFLWVCISLQHMGHSMAHLCEN